MLPARILPPSVFLLLLLLGPSGCGGGGSGLPVGDDDASPDDDSTPDDDSASDDDSSSSDDDTTPPPVEPTFSAIQAQIFGVSCTQSSCHSTSGHRGDLILAGSDAYDNLIEQPAHDSDAAADGWVRVVPRDSDSSFLILKLLLDELPSEYGDPMPDETETGLPADQIATLRTWIDNGAMND